MSQDIADMPGIEAAMEHFETIEKSSPEVTPAATTAPDKREPIPADAPPAADKSKARNSDSKPTPRAGRPSLTEGPKAATGSKDTKASSQPTGETKVDHPTDAKPDANQPADDPNKSHDSNKSRYAKSQERLTRTWESVNAEKASVAGEKARLEADRAELTRQRAEFDQIRQQAAQPQYSADDYVKAAHQKRQGAEATRTQARRAEESGKFEESARLNKLADKLEGQAEDMAEYAENLRKNPPATFQQRALQQEDARRFFTLEAAKAWPDLAKDGSEFQRAVAAELQGVARNDPQLAAHPSAIYHASRMVHLTLRARALETEAARVPGLVKEAESLRAKIKELEALTTPAGGGSVARVGADAPADDYATLRQAAEQSGTLFR
jgi:hypothetical protein